MNCSTGIPSRHNLVLISMLALFAILLVFTYGIISIPTADAKYVFSKKWGTLGTGNGQFNNPEGIAADSSGNVYVSDTGNNRIQQFKLTTTCPSGTAQIVPGICFVRTWGTLGAGIGQFNKPRDVALDSSGRIFVVDSGNNRIQQFRGNGAFIRAWSTDGPGTAQFTPLDIAVDTSTNDIYVAVSTVGQGILHKFRLANPCPVSTIEVVSGICFIDRWRYGQAPSSPPDDLHSLLGVGVNHVTHDVYVSFYTDVTHPGDDSFDEYWIIRRDVNGNDLASWGGRVSGIGVKFNNPTGIAIGPSGLVYVADTRNNRVQTFQLTIPCPSGTAQVKPGVCLFTKWGTSGSANGQFDGPNDVAIDGPLGHVYVADTVNDRIQEFIWKTDAGGPGGGTNTPHVP